MLCKKTLLTSAVVLALIGLGFLVWSFTRDTGSGGGFDPLDSRGMDASRAGPSRAVTESAAVIIGHVIGPDAHGVDDVEVRRRLESLDAGGVDGEDGLVKTGPGGDFEFRLPPGAWRLRLQFRHRDFSPLDLARNILAGETIDLGDVVLTAGGVVAGVARDDLGAGLAGVLIEVGPPRVRTGRGGLTLIAGIDDERAKTTTTDADGAYHITGVPVGRVHAIASADGCPPVARRDLSVELDATTTADFDIARGRRLTGTVRSSTGEVIAGAVVEIGVVGARPDDRILVKYLERTTKSNAAGEWELTGVGPRRLRLRASCPGYVIPPDRLIGLIEDNVEIVMTPAAIPWGYVRDADGGALIDDVEISVDGTGRRDKRARGRIVRGDEAAAVVGAVAASSLYAVVGLTRDRIKLRVDAEGYTSGCILVEDLRPGERRESKIELRREIELSGIVTTLTGTPLADAVIEAEWVAEDRRQDDLATAFMTGDLERFDPENGYIVVKPVERISTTSDEDGKFRLRGLGNARYRLHTRHDACLRGDVLTVALDPSDPITGLTIRLQEGSRIEGDVLDATGRAVPGREVYVRRAPADENVTGAGLQLFSPIVQTVRTDGRGSFVATGLRAGAYVVALEKGGRGKRVAIRRGQVATVTLTLE